MTLWDLFYSQKLAREVKARVKWRVKHVTLAGEGGLDCIINVINVFFYTETNGLDQSQP